MTPEVAGIGYVILVAALMGLVAFYLKQPVIPAYIIGGIIIGPLGLKLVHEPGAIQALTELAIVLVMFVIGLEMDIRRIRSVGSVVMAGGVIQVLATGALGFGICYGITQQTLLSVYMGLIFGFGSTTLVVKLLADRQQLATIHGRITLGMLLLQDIAAIIALSFISARGVSSDIVIGTIIKAFGLVAIAITAGQYVFPMIFRRIAKSNELLTIVSLGVGFLFAFLAESQGLSASIGAFITGVSLANLPYCVELLGRVKALRDFFLPIFFAALGLQLVVPGVHLLLPIIALLIGCMILKPLLAMIIVALFGYQERTAFFVGTALVPTSEFGLIIVALGIKTGRIGPEAMTITLVIIALSMLLSSYVFSENLYGKLNRQLHFLDFFSRGRSKEEELETDGHEQTTILLIGCHRVGRYIIESRADVDKFFVIEHDPDRFDVLNELGTPCVYADATESEVWDKLGAMPNLRMIISTIPDVEQNIEILAIAHNRWPGVKVVLAAEQSDDEQRLLLDKDADYVLSPYTIAGLYIKDGGLAGIFDPETIADERAKAVEHLHEKMQTWCKHPYCRQHCHLQHKPVRQKKE